MRGNTFTEKTYPHLSDTKFPDLPTVDVYKYKNEVPYEEYSDTVKIKMMNVSWCGDYNNTVYFETKQERDDWFNAQTGLVKELPTMFRLYPSGTIKVPCTIDEAMNYNYVMINYGKTLYQEELSDNHIMFYFINDVVQKSPNATELTLVVDFWTTYINDMDIEYVSLSRGHAPMVEMPADTYLENPIENCEYLLTTDVNYGDFQRVANTETVIFNDDSDKVTVGFMTNASMQKSWTKSGNRTIPTAAFEYSQHFSAVDTFVIENISYWRTFRENVTEQCPQFWETVKGMFIIPKKLITESNYTTGNQFVFCGVVCHHLETDSDKKFETVTFTKDKFNYPDEFADIAKMYTFPYAAIEVNDFKGNNMIIKIEETSGSVELHTIMCDMFPFLNVEAYMTGIGSSKKYSISFRNSYENTFNIGGRDYNFNTKWSIPVFSVQLEAEDNWELNGKITSDMFLENNSRRALAIRDNLYDQSRVAGYNAVTSKNFGLVSTIDKQLPANDIQMYQHNRGQYLNFARSMLHSHLGWVASADKAAAATLLSMGTGLLSMSVAATGNAALVPASGVAAISGVASSGTNFMVNQFVNKPQVQGDSIIDNKYLSKMYGPEFDDPNTFYYLSDTITGVIASDYNTGKSRIESAFDDLTGAGNYVNFLDRNSVEGAKYYASRDCIEEVAGLNAESQESIYNNNRRLVIGGEVSYKSRNWADTDAVELVGTANRSYNADIANYNNRWDAEHRQMLLTNPPMFGQLTGTPDIISKPFGLRYNFLTQSKNAIRQTGEQFLRYGYMLNMEWKVDTFNLMSMFTYWKCDRVYCNDKGVYEGAQDMIKSILEAGTTVWRRPEDIGVKSIYQNKIPM